MVHGCVDVRPLQSPHASPVDRVAGRPEQRFGVPSGTQRSIATARLKYCSSIATTSRSRSSASILAPPPARGCQSSGRSMTACALLQAAKTSFSRPSRTRSRGPRTRAAVEQQQPAALPQTREGRAPRGSRSNRPRRRSTRTPRELSLVRPLSFEKVRGKLVQSVRREAEDRLVGRGGVELVQAESLPVGKRGLNRSIRTRRQPEKGGWRWETCGTSFAIQAYSAGRLAWGSRRVGSTRRPRRIPRPTSAIAGSAGRLPPCASGGGSGC